MDLIKLGQESSSGYTVSSSRSIDEPVLKKRRSAPLEAVVKNEPKKCFDSEEIVYID